MLLASCRRAAARGHTRIAGHHGRQRRHEARTRHRLIAARRLRALQPLHMHMRSESDDARLGDIEGGSDRANRADGIQPIAIEIQKHQIRRVCTHGGQHRVRLANEGDGASGRSGDRSDAGAEQQVVDDRQDHGKMIPDMVIRTAAVTPFYKNGYVVSCETTRDAVLIDPGDEVDALLEAVAADRVNVTAILLTHAHLDHVTGVAQAKRALGAPVWLHRDDEFLYRGVVEQGLMFGLRVEKQPPIDHFYQPGVPLAFGEYTVDVLHTPGHCPGGISPGHRRRMRPSMLRR